MYQQQLNEQNYVAAGSSPTRLAIDQRESRSLFPFLSYLGQGWIGQGWIVGLDKLWRVSLRFTHNTNPCIHIPKTNFGFGANAYFSDIFIPTSLIVWEEANWA